MLWVDAILYLGVVLIHEIPNWNWNWRVLRFVWSEYLPHMGSGYQRGHKKDGRGFSKSTRVWPWSLSTSSPRM